MPRLYLFVLLLWLLASPLARAQTLPAVDPPWVPDTTRRWPENAPSATNRLRPGSASLADTTAALHRLFAAKRSSRNKVLVATLLCSSAVIGVTVAANSGPGSEAFVALGALVMGVVLVPSALVVELVAYNNNFSRRQERLTIADWQAHRLAPYMRRHLEPRYFEPDAPPRP